MTARYIVGDVLEALATLPDGSVDLVFTSPPFLALRSYLPADHPDKAKEIGSEPTPGEFIDALLDVTEALDRVLAPHGSLCFELGDTYSGSGGAGGDYTESGLRAAQPAFTGSAYARRIESTMERTGPGRTTAARKGWPLDKSMCLIPELYRMALSYGFNPLTGRQTAPWRVRNVVRWHRPNPPVGALGDKFRPATSDVVIACKSRTRYFDLDAVRSEPAHGYVSTRSAPNHREIPGQPKNLCNPLNEDGLRIDCNPAGAPPLDTWIIPTAPYKGSHYATFPPALVVKPLLAMCPERVCTSCGEPSRRVTDVDYERDERGGTNGKRRDLTNPDGHDKGMRERHDGAAMAKVVTTLGWTDCGHDSWRTGVVLDPFAGSGTVLSVASGHGRDSIGIDLDERNAELARARVGMFLSIEYPAVVA
jgi:site-specific DNA-methyltransferase (adenine-specific)